MSETPGGSPGIRGCSDPVVVRPMSGPLKNPDVLGAPHEAVRSSIAVNLARSFMDTFREAVRVIGSREGKLVLAACPVAVLLVSCSGGDRPVPGRVERLEILVTPGPPVEYVVSAALPETLRVPWPGGGLVRTESIVSVPGSELSAGDTIALGVDSMALLQVELASMEVSFAAARLEASPGDPAALSALERALDRRDSLVALSTRVLLAPAPGLLLGVPEIGDLSSSPGAAVMVLPPGDSFTLSVPPGGVAVTWPAKAGDATLVEDLGDSAIYSGSPPGETLVLPESFSVPRPALRERGLGSFVILGGGDTLDVTPLVLLGETVFVGGDLAPGSEVRSWAPEMEDR